MSHTKVKDSKQAEITLQVRILSMKTTDVSGQRTSTLHTAIQDSEKVQNSLNFWTVKKCSAYVVKDIE